MNGLFDWAVRVFQAGGWVMVPLLLLSVVSLAIAFERLLFWASAHRPGRTAWVTRLCDDLDRAPAAAARAAAADRTVYGRFVQALTAGGSAATAALAVEAVRPSIERFSTTLSTIITAAPMLGILGTVVGIIDSFRLLGAADETVIDPAQVAGGIAEALITTAFGLIIALATLFPYVLVRASADRCFTRLELMVEVRQQRAPGAT